VSYVFHRNLHQTLPNVVKGEGSFLFDQAGKRYLDACGGAAVSCLGHNVPSVTAAITKQLSEMAYAHSGFFTNDPAEELASYLVKNAPCGFGKGRAMFLGSGSEAMEASLKLVRQYHLERGDHQREVIIAREMSYHGNSLGALATGGHPERRKPYAPLLMDVERIATCYTYRLKNDDETMTAYGQRAAQVLEEKICEIGPEKVAAFVVEPVSGATLGSVPPAEGYFQKIRQICDKYGVLLVADEVMCGMGRTGSLYALEQEEVAPDIITVAKGLGAGFQPISAVLANENVINTISLGSGTLWNGHTYMSHAVACAGALEVLNVIERDQLLDQVNKQGLALEQGFKTYFADKEYCGDIRGRGLFWTIELVSDRQNKTPFPASWSLAAKIKKAAQAKGLLCYPSSGCVDGVNGDHVLLAPPYTVTDEELTMALDILRSSIEDCLGQENAH